MTKKAADYFEEFNELARLSPGVITQEQVDLFCIGHYLLREEGEDYYSDHHADMGKQLLRPN